MIRSSCTQDNSILHKIKLTFFTTKRCENRYFRADLVLCNVRHLCLCPLILPDMGSFKVHLMVEDGGSNSNYNDHTAVNKKEEKEEKKKRQEKSTSSF